MAEAHGAPKKETPMRVIGRTGSGKDLAPSSRREEHVSKDFGTTTFEVTKQLCT